jgi:hypothetical protein
MLNGQQIEEIFKHDTPVKIMNPLFSHMSLEVYKIKEGVIVIRHGQDEFPLYPSEEVLIHQLTSHPSPEVKDILEGINIYGEDFPKKAQTLAKDFLDRIIVDYNKQSSIDILKAVDRHINVNRNKKFFDENFLSLVSVIGELVNRDYGSGWVVVKSKRSETWTPTLIYKGQHIYFDDYILIDFDNKNQQNPLLNVYLSIVDIMQINIR